MRPFSAMCGALIAVTAFAAPGGARAERSMMASIVEGSATVQNTNGEAQALRQGTAVHEGDLIQTGADSRVEISMSDGSALRIGENARFELRVAPPAGKMFAARLWLGAVWAKVHKLLQDESFQLETENAVAGVRGTEFLVEAGGAGHDDNVRVYEGAVEVHDHAGIWMHRIEPGRELSFRRGSKPEGPRFFDPASEHRHPLMRWIREHPVHASESSERSGTLAPAKERERKDRPGRRGLLERRIR